MPLFASSERQIMPIFHDRQAERNRARGYSQETGKDFKNILLNMGESTYIDSAGLGEPIAAYTTVKNRGGHLELLNLSLGPSFG
jgi:anti-anti-sigma regulatory factor